MCKICKYIIREWGNLSICKVDQNNSYCGFEWMFEVQGVKEKRECDLGTIFYLAFIQFNFMIACVFKCN